MAYHVKGLLLEFYGFSKSVELHKKAQEKLVKMSIDNENNKCYDKSTKRKEK